MANCIIIIIIIQVEMVCVEKKKVACVCFRVITTELYHMLYSTFACVHVIHFIVLLSNR